MPTSSKTKENHRARAQAPGDAEAEVEAAANSHPGPRRPPRPVPGSEVQEAGPGHPPRRPRQHRLRLRHRVRGRYDRPPDFLADDFLAPLRLDGSGHDPDRPLHAHDSEPLLGFGVEVNQAFAFEGDGLESDLDQKNKDHADAGDGDDAAPVNGGQA